MYNILIVEDQVLIAEAWSLILSTEGFEVCSMARGAKQAIEEAKKYRPDIVLMDINLKEGDGYEVTEEIVNTLPKTKVIGLSFYDEIALVKKMINKGAKGYLTKDCSKSELIEAINSVMDGEQYISKEIKDKFVSSMLNEREAEVELTSREIEVIKLIAKGFTSKEIGKHLDVSSRTIDTHRYNALKKLDLPNSALLSIWAKEKGFV